jgi:hypothetical protein
MVIISLLLIDFYPMDTGGKAAGAWNWTHAPNYSWGQEYVDLYIHSTIRLYGEVFNYLSTEEILQYFTLC